MKTTSPSAPFRWTVSILYTAAITMASLTPRVEGLPSLLYLDKIAHFFAYGVYVLVLAWALKARTRPLVWIVAIAVFCSLYGVMMEFCQKLIAPDSRSFSIADMIANAAGAITCAPLTAFATRT
jgi:VanZ family protein